MRERYVVLAAAWLWACSATPAAPAGGPEGGRDDGGAADAGAADASAGAPDAGEIGDAGARLDVGVGPAETGPRDAGMCGGGPACAADETCRRGFCMQSTLPTWDLGILPADLAALEADPYSNTLRPCTLRYGATTYANCRVRLRGGSSREYPKHSFRIEFPEGAPHPGLTRKINLRAEFNDGSMARNYLSHEMFRRFTTKPVPLTRYIDLRLNGQEYGVMLEVERIAGAFLERNGRDRTRPTFEADPDSALHNMGGTTLIPLRDPALYPRAFQQASGPDGDYSDLVAFVETTLAGDSRMYGRTVPTRLPATRMRFDVDGFVDQLAVYAVIQSADHAKKNWYLSNQLGPNGPRFEYYPWDLDLTFGCLYNVDQDNSLCGPLVTDLEPNVGARDAMTLETYPTEAFFNELMHMVLNEQTASVAYRARICEILASRFWTTELDALIGAVDDTIAPYVAMDPNDRNMSRADFVTNLDQLREFRRLRTTELNRMVPCP